MYEGVEALVAACLDRMEGEAAIDAVCRDHPGQAAELRRRLDALRDLGVLEPRPAFIGDAFPGRLGDFQLLRDLGGGGMGQVYLAHQESRSRQVALKIVRPDLLFFPIARERFRAEVRTVGRLDHPGVVKIYSVGEANELPYFAMELLEGCTLAQVIQELQGRSPEDLDGADIQRAIAHATDDAFGDPSPGAEPYLFSGTWVEVCLRIVKTIALALEHVHARGVLHRDVKPSNVMVTPDGRAKLIDFGLAGFEGMRGVTRSGTQPGSLPYMSPEQLRGKRSSVDRRTDVYSLGVLLYELLTLQPPFFSEHDDEVLRRRILHGRVRSPRLANSAVTKDVVTVCLKAMDPKSSARYARAADFARDLRNLLEHRPIVARPRGPLLGAWRWTRRHPTWSVAVLLFVAGFGALFGMQTSALRQSEGLRLIASSAAVRAHDPGLALVLGLEAAEAQPRLSANNLLCAALAELHERFTFPHEAGTGAPAFDPGGARLLTWSAPGGAVIRDLGSGAELLRIDPPGETVVRAAWDAAGERILTLLTREARVFDASTGRLESRFPAGGPHRHAALSADGSRLLVCDGDGRAEVWDPWSGASIGARSFARGIVRVALSPNGALVAVAQDDGSVSVWEPSQDASRVLFVLDAASSVLEFSPDGTALLTGSPVGHRLDALGGGTEPLRWTADLAPNPAAAFVGPRGDRVIIASGKGATLRDTDGGGALRSLPDRPPFVTLLAASADGTRVAAASKDWTVCVSDPGSGDEITVLRGHRDDVESIVFGPDGHRVCTSARDGTARVWTLEPALETRRLPLDVGGRRPASARFDPATARVAVARSDRHEAWVCDLAGSAEVGPLRHDGPITRVAFSPDGTLVATCGGDRTARVWDAAEGSLVREFSGHRGVVWYAEVSPDSRLLATCSSDGTARVWSIETGVVLLEKRQRGARLGTVAFDRTGERIVTGNTAGECTVYEVATGAKIAELARPHAGLVDRAVFSPDGTRIASCSVDETVRVWRAATGNDVAELEGHTAEVYSVAFDARGEHLVTTSRDGTARVWSVPQEREILTLHVPRWSMIGAAFSADGEWVLTVDECLTVIRWPIDPVACARRLKPRELSAEERRLAGVTDR